MNGEAVQKIAEYAVEGALGTVEVDGVHYSPVGLEQVAPKLYTPDAIKVHTLTGLVRYLETNRDSIDPSEVVVHVESPTRVSVVSGIQGERNQRFTYARARAASVDIAGQGWLAPGDMTVALNTLCTDAGDRDDVVALVGNVADENSIRQEDDGFTQKVTVKGGVTLVGEKKVPNPVRLAPYRTFREAGQPLSPFLLRFRGGEGTKAALFEADAGTWQLAAVTNVVEYLVEHVPDGFEVIG